jgi:hypothetical protein
MGSDEPQGIGKVPTATAVEVVSRVAEAGLSAIPIAGGPIAGLLDAVIAPSLAKRKDAWLNRLAFVVTELQDRLRDFDPQQLGENEAFVTTVVQTTILAMKTSQEEKLIALRNAALNSLLPGAPDELEQSIFLRYVDELTPLHLRVMSLVAEPKTWFRQHYTGQVYTNAALSEVTEQAFPEMQGRPEVLDLIVDDLESRGLIEPSGGKFLHRESILSRTVWGKTTTSLGDRFLAFVSEPSGDS